MVFVQDDDGACALFLLGGITFGVDGFLVLSWWCLVRCYKELVTVAGLSFYLIIIFWLCVYVLPLGHLLLQRLGVICIFVILIYPLYKK
jgi:hypothetical protein